MALSLEKSRAEFERAKKVIPGGVNSPARAFGAVGGTPPIIRQGDGATMEDIDGNRYLDYVGSWGPHILGHNHSAVRSALENALSLGTSFGAPCHSETELAELVVSVVPSIEMVRMVNSGTEAGMSVIRLARGATGRDKIVKFAGCYHGHVDSLLVAAGSGALTHGVPNSPGVPLGCSQDTIVLEYNNVAALEELFAAKGEEIALLILEPVCGNMGVVIPTPEFLSTARHLCDQHGTLLCFDEVMTGFRVAFGGAQQLWNVTPDLTMLGKVIGGGLPVGAYGGRRDIMEQVSPVGPVYQAGTLSGNPLAMASGLAILRTLQEEQPYPQLEQRTARLSEGLLEQARCHGIDAICPHVGSMFTLFFTADPVSNLETAQRSNTQRFAEYFWGMLEEGIYLPCSQFEANFVSTRHDDAAIDQTIAAAGRVFAKIATTPRS